MDKLQPVIDTLKTALLEKLGAEVDLIFQYGSHVKGLAHKYSDVDISYVPVHETTWECITVMVDDTLFDFYPMHWSLLERMADFHDLSSSVLLNNRILYQRDKAAGARFESLAARLRALQGPESKPEMLRRAMEIFQGIGYEYYLLRQQAEDCHQAGCLKSAQSIFRAVLHCLAVCNQAFIDTRKMEQVLALPSLPVGFAEAVQRMLDAVEPGETLKATEALLKTTRQFLLEEQCQYLRSKATYPDVLDSGYPELKRDIQAVMMACENEDMFSAKGSLLSLLHEMSRAVVRVSSGVAYSGFNGMSEYEQDLSALGLPTLLPYLAARDFAGLHRQCQAFDQRLKEFLFENAVELNNFATLSELQEYLKVS
jgi:predicted nucleotidyltransferase